MRLVLDENPDMSSSVTLYATARPQPVDGIDDGRRQDYTATQSNYESAYDALVAQIPEGWQMLGISRWPTNISSATPAAPVQVPPDE